MFLLVVVFLYLFVPVNYPRVHIEQYVSNNMQTIGPSKRHRKQGEVPCLCSHFTNNLWHNRLVIHMIEH